MSQEPPCIQVNITVSPEGQLTISVSGEYIINFPVQPAPAPKKELPEQKQDEKPKFVRYYVPKTTYPENFEIRLDQSTWYFPL